MSVDSLTREARDAFAGYAEPQTRPPFRSYAALTAMLVSKDKVTSFVRAPPPSTRGPAGPPKSTSERAARASAEPSASS